jgi:uncharacterized protein (DUF433 family)
MVKRDELDWSQCPLVETNARVQSGAPVLRGTRLPVSAIIDNFDYGVSVAEIAAQFEIAPESVQTILSYAQSQLRIDSHVNEKRRTKREPKKDRMKFVRRITHRPACGGRRSSRGIERLTKLR